MIYIMQRTQIYLGEEEALALGRLAKRLHRTRSDLIRDAIRTCYLVRPEASLAEAVIEETYGAWALHGETGAASVERLRSGRLARTASRPAQQERSASKRRT